MGRVCLFLLLLGSTAVCQEWPQWRGPNRDGVATGFAAPNAWPKELKLVWKATAGEGHSSPVVAGRQVFVLTRENDQEVVSAFDLESGKRRWRDSYPAPYEMNPAARAHGKGPKSTPAVHSGRLYTLGITGILSCYDAANGELRWRKEFSKQFPQTSPYYGTAMSPLVDNGMVIIHAGGHDKGALMAFDAATGALRWKWEGDGPAYASPIAVSIDGERQVVTQTQQNIVAVAESSGALLWKLAFSTPYVQNIVTPLAYKDLLIFSGLAQGTFAVRPVREKDGWKANEAWRTNDVGMYMNSPVLAGGRLWGMSHLNKGQFFCLDAGTGKTLWKGEPRQGDNAAIAAAGGVLLIENTDGELIVAAPDGGGIKALQRYRVADSATWAHPALAANRIIVKDVSTLAAWSVE